MLLCCRTEFHSLLDGGQTQEALQLLRTQMTPLSQQHPGLQPKLQVTYCFELLSQPKLHFELSVLAVWGLPC